MMSDRPYRKSLTQEEVFDILRRCKGTQFDPDVIDALIAAVGK